MKELDSIGLENAARFAIQPNMYGFCGENESQKILRDFITKQNDEIAIVKETLSSHGFPHLNAFLNAIAGVTKDEPFSNEIVMSYWFGSDVIERTFNQGKAFLVKEYSEQISPEFSKQLDLYLPPQIYLTHLSQVALIAAADYDEPDRVNLINQCMIAAGKIFSVDTQNNMAVVERESLRKNGVSGYDVEISSQRVRIDKDLANGLLAGEDVAIHLGYIAGKITPELNKQLRYWTKKVAKLI